MQALLCPESTLNFFHFILFFSFLLAFAWKNELFGFLLDFARKIGYLRIRKRRQRRGVRGFTFPHWFDNVCAL